MTWQLTVNGMRTSIFLEIFCSEPNILRNGPSLVSHSLQSLMSAGGAAGLGAPGAASSCRVVEAAAAAGVAVTAEDFGLGLFLAILFQNKFTNVMV